MQALDSALRGAGGALLLLLGCIVLRDARRSPAGLYGGLFAFGVVLGLLDDAPTIAPQAAGWLLPLRLLKDGNPALFYLFAAACFADGFTLAGWQAALWLATVGLGALCRFGPWHGAWYAYDAVAVLLSLLAVRLALVGRAVDLVEGRRRFRTVLVCVAALYGIALTASGALLSRQGAAVALGLANAGGILAMALVTALSRLGIARASPAESLGLAESGGLLEDAPAAAVTPLDAEETRLLAALKRLMEEERVYRAEGLGIAELARRLAIPEYRLRRLINQRLGHRNFSTYVNGYRLADAKAALADPAQAEVPILTIALDAGFQSIGPFNRAFKAETGLTPSEYRRRGGTAEIAATA